MAVTDLERSAAGAPEIPETPRGGRAMPTREGAVHLDLRGADLAALDGIGEEQIARLARIVRGLAFTAVDGAKSGHPGGSSSKTEMVLALIASGVFGFDATRPKHPGRDRLVWSAGHCSPLFHALVALVYEALRRSLAVLSGNGTPRPSGTSRRSGPRTREA